MNVIPIGGQHLCRPEGLNIIETGEIFGPIAPIDWLCKGLLIAPGAPTEVQGYGYSGKSAAMQGLSLSVASGCKLWGTFTCEQGHVLHLDYEQGGRLSRDRYHRLAYAERIDIASLVRSGRLQLGVLPSLSLNADILCRIGHGRKLVVIDSWRAAHPDVDENSSEVRKTLDVMGGASEKTGCTFVVLTHGKKPSKDDHGAKYSGRGSSGFFDGPQTIFHLDGEEAGRPKVTQTKERLTGREIEPFILAMSDTDGRQGLLVRAEIVTEPSKPSFESQSKKIEAFLKECREGVAGIELLAEKVGIGEKRVGAIVSSLEALGAVVRRRPAGSRGNSQIIVHMSHIVDAPF